MEDILHGTWLPQRGRLLIWGERPFIPRRPTRRLRQPVHPFQSSIEGLRRRLGEQFPEASDLASEGVTLLLPTSGGRPVPSPEIGAVRGASRTGPTTLRPWRISGLVCTPAQAIALLLGIGSDPAIGADLVAWRVATLLALEIAAGQQLLPGLVRDGSRFKAVWLPRPLPDTAASIATLARTLPPICRAAGNNPVSAPAPRQVVDSFLAALIDALVRGLSAQGKQLAPVFAMATGGIATPGSAWVAALIGSEPHLNLRPNDAEELFRAWQQWSEQGQVAGDENFRVALRLEPPPTDEQPWALSYHLQAVDQVSLLVPAAQIWRERGNMLLIDARRFSQPQERLLRALAFAGRLFSPIAESMRDAAPERALFRTDEAFAFLKETAPLLEQSGFAVIVPNWWADRGRIKARAQAWLASARSGSRASKATRESSGALALDGLVRFRWQLSLGNQQLTREEFEQLVARQQPLVQIRGEWVAFDPSQVQQALELLNDRGQMSVADLLRMSLAGGEPLANGVEVVGAEAEGRLGEMLRSLTDSRQLRELKPPKGLKATLRPYQVRGYSWLNFMTSFGLGACLADDMGLGKSVEAIAHLLEDRAKFPDGGPTLIVCPASVIGNWRREIARFAPSLRVMSYQGPDRPRDAAMLKAIAAHDVILTGYQLLARDREALAKITWRCVILDEAQNIKNSETRQAQAARALKAEARIALTGTPVENRLGDLWSIMAFLNPGYLGAEREFHRTLARPIERANDAAATRRLRALTAPFILRRLKTDPKVISDLPEKIENKVFVPLTTEQATLYEATVRDAMAQIEGAEGEAMRRRGLVLAMLVRLKQICNHPANFLKRVEKLDHRSGKLDRLVEMLEEVISERDRALIFTQFAEMGSLLQGHLGQQFGEEEVLYFYGGTPLAERDEMIARFQAPTGPKIFVLSLKAGGVGLNLTSANHVFHFDRWWNPAVEDQATDRAFRIGQTRNVQVHKFVCVGTLEERIDSLIESKRSLAENILGEGEGWLTELSTDQLRELVMLRRDEISD